MTTVAPLTGCCERDRKLLCRGICVGAEPGSGSVPAPAAGAARRRNCAAPDRRAGGAVPARVAGSGALQHAAADGRGALVAEVGQRQRADEEHGGADRRGARQEVGAAGGAEQAARGAAAEAAPMSAPLPCCISTRPIMPSADSICTTTSRVFKYSIHSLIYVRDSDAFACTARPRAFSAAAAADRQKIGGLQRRAADQAAVDVGLREQLLRRCPASCCRRRGSACRAACAVAACSCARSSACTCLRLLRRRGLAGADGPDRFVGDDDLRRCSGRRHGSPRPAGA